MTRTEKRSNRRLVVLCLLVVLLLAATAFGTMAWLTASDSVTNTFTVGNFNKPDPGPDGQGPTGDPLPEDLDGYIVEPSWKTDEKHKLVPGASLAKDPYVGIGKDSEEAIVYVYVQNPFKNNSVYFTLNSDWSAVDGYATKVGDANNYSEGLFKYDTTLQAGATDNVWTTTPVFSSVVVADGAKTEDLNITEKDIVVSCFLHQAKDGDAGAASLATEALTAAEAWADKIKTPAGSP